METTDADVWQLDNTRDDGGLKYPCGSCQLKGLETSLQKNESSLRRPWTQSLRRVGSVLWLGYSLWLTACVNVKLVQFAGVLYSERGGDLDGQEDMLIVS